MKIHYDQQVDAIYIHLSDSIPDGVVEIKEGVNIDTTEDGKLTGIEILDASKKMNLDTLLSYTIEFDPSLLRPPSPGQDHRIAA
ncbi:DUF2283 domain-containing protein [Desulfonatronum lacustre]|uniref:DUF2283 domain-containing protein n=1 Tax=Desulfonatronum lacustre TaxID=66849 RepID=UPI000685478D|nr:DUF2283 domain-containing protein [Desulfonatronum lacustre]